MDTDQVADMADPLARSAGLEVYDVELHGNVLRVSLVGHNSSSPDVDALELVSRSLALELDEAEFGGGAYVLELSSPGLERSLRTVRHFETAVGEFVTVTTAPGPEGRLRVRGELEALCDGRITIVDERLGATEIAIGDIEKARTIFEWGPKVKPGKKNSDNYKAKTAARSGAAKSSTGNRSTTDNEASP